MQVNRLVGFPGAQRWRSCHQQHAAAALKQPDAQAPLAGTRAVGNSTIESCHTMSHQGGTSHLFKQHCNSILCAHAQAVNRLLLVRCSSNGEGNVAGPQRAALAKRALQALVARRGEEVGRHPFPAESKSSPQPARM